MSHARIRLQPVSVIKSLAEPSCFLVSLKGQPTAFQIPPYTMPRSRVMSFMSQWGAPSRNFTPEPKAQTEDPFSSGNNPSKPRIDTALPSAASKPVDASDSPSPSTQQRFRSDSRSERTSRPMSMVYTYQPPIMDLAQDTLPELQPIFTFLNSHSNKLYQEGYFLKLHDLDSRE